MANTDKSTVGFQISNDLERRLESWRHNRNLTKSDAYRKLLRQALDEQDRSIGRFRRCELWNFVNTILLAIAVTMYVI